MIDLGAIRRLSDIPRVQASALGDQTAMVHNGHATSFRQLDARANRVAQGLLAAGVRPGDRVCVLTRNTDRFFDLLFGAAKARACLAPINFRLAAPEIAYILRDAGARLLFVGEGFFDAAERVAGEMESPVRLIALTGEPAGWETLETWAAGFPPLDPSLAETDDDDVLQLYTSGTTGHPKGVVLSNRNYRRFLETSSGVDGFDYRSDETLMIVMPLFHVAGVNVSCAGLAHGCRVIVVRDFVPAEALATLRDEAVAHTFIAPAMILMMLQSSAIADGGFPALRTIAYGASPISEEVLTRAKAAFGCGFVQYYGMTESTGGGTYLSPRDHDLGEKLRSCGKPWPDTEVAIMGPALTPLAPREVGEIAIRGDCVMKGYWNRPEATAQAVRNGWLLTGDAGFQDEDGYFYVHDRMKDMIITGGENVYPAEVENAVFGCPGVADVAVIGVPSEIWGEEVKAIVVAAPGAAPDPAAIIAWARERIAGYKAPKSVDFIDALPRNASGKVLRRDLREAYWAGRDRRVG
jgi:acyl-CoA synthetase (AMP-forming)/AMP-acid ligase II